MELGELTAPQLESKRRHFSSSKNRYGHGRTGRTVAAGPGVILVHSYMAQLIADDVGCISARNPITLENTPRPHTPIRQMFLRKIYTVVCECVRRMYSVHGMILPSADIGMA